MTKVQDSPEIDRYQEEQRRKQKRARFRTRAVGLGLSYAVVITAFAIIIQPQIVSVILQLSQQKWFLVGLFVPLFTFLFDLIDLRPIVGSFSFVGSRTYLVYLGFRITLAFLATAVLGATGLVSDPLLLAMISVITSVTVLQNFALNVAGNNAANLSDVFATFKDTMAKEESERVARQKDAELLKLTRVLSKLPLQELKSQARQIYLRAKTDANQIADPITSINGLPEVEAISFLSDFLVKQNPEYCRWVIQSVPG